MNITVNIINNGVINMTGFPTLTEKGKEYETSHKHEKHEDQKTDKTDKIEKQEHPLKQSEHRLKRSHKQRQEDIDKFKREKPWGSLLEEIISNKEERTIREDKTQQQRKIKSDVMKELVSGTQRKDTHKKKRAKEEFIPTAYLTWTPFKNNTIVYDVTAEEIDIETLKKFSCMPSMMVFYKTKIATFGTYQLEQPLMINNKVVF